MISSIPVVGPMECSTFRYWAGSECTEEYSTDDRHRLVGSAPQIDHHRVVNQSEWMAEWADHRFLPRCCPSAVRMQTFLLFQWPKGKKGGTMETYYALRTCRTSVRIWCCGKLKHFKNNNRHILQRGRGRWKCVPSPAVTVTVKVRGP